MAIVHILHGRSGFKRQQYTFRRLKRHFNLLQPCITSTVVVHILHAKKEENGFGFLDIVRIYARRLVRILPLFYLTFLAGIFLGPRISSGGVWFMYEQALFW
jgi:hypothetical protein